MDAAAAGGTAPEPKAGHKRKVALFMAYVGAGYMVRDVGTIFVRMMRRA